jgi:hypothetical protein
LPCRLNAHAHASVCFLPSRAGKFKEAERLYLTIDDPDAAISMYKKNRQFDQVDAGLLFLLTTLLAPCSAPLRPTI